MRRNLFLIIAFLAILFSCSKEDVTQQQADELAQKLTKNAQIDQKVIDRAIDSFFNTLPDKIEMDYTKGQEIHTMSDGTKKTMRLKQPVSDGISKKANYTTEIDISIPDEGLPVWTIPGARIFLVGKYMEDAGSYYQSEYVGNPVDFYGNKKVVRSLFGVTRWMEGLIGKWRGYANYVVYNLNTIERTKQVEWDASWQIPRR
ncbi:hypothetical protein DRF65_13670 [Chryseobacterium pennae]|uniref:Uncharacterized protein n=1 Tax=Chryseobacterium pennae TaxID=2258962 RepID=A0A3D9C8G2_9FLAO|nr:hypothetical protein [Chryseobacterium pennae]REC61782.1 hypothetical protein DRF65_13670 [Chryseobacterium pennae]